MQTEPSTDKKDEVWTDWTITIVSSIDYFVLRLWGTGVSNHN